MFDSWLLSQDIFTADVEYDECFDFCASQYTEDHPHKDLDIDLWKRQNVPTSDEEKAHAIAQAIQQDPKSGTFPDLILHDKLVTERQAWERLIPSIERCKSIAFQEGWYSILVSHFAQDLKEKYEFLRILLQHTESVMNKLENMLRRQLNNPEVTMAFKIRSLEYRQECMVLRKRIEMEMQVLEILTKDPAT